MTTARPFDVLLLDFGGVCLVNPVELHAEAEVALGLPRGTFTWLGPLDPSTDTLWQELTMGEVLQEREYWARRAADVGAAVGQDFSVRDYMHLIYEPARNSLIRPEATSVVEHARAAGYSVSILTNDLRAFHGPAWQRGIDFFDLIDHVVDCSETGILKPDSRAYAHAVDIAGAEPARTLFVDDQSLSVVGAEQCGIDSMWFDIANASASWQLVAERLGLSVDVSVV